MPGSAHKRTLELYKDRDGRVPLKEWLTSLKDKHIRSAINRRITRLQVGDFGDCKRIVGGEGVSELRIHIGPGYRLYFAEMSSVIVLLLCGGTKSKQQKDIRRATSYLQDYINRQANE